MKGKGDFAQTSHSLPNTGNHFLDIEIPGVDRVFSHSLDFDFA
jgi:hypothetical protein